MRIKVIDVFFFFFFEKIFLFRPFPISLFLEYCIVYSITVAMRKKDKGNL